MGHVAAYLRQQHMHLASLVAHCVRDPEVDLVAFERFRAELLRHIGAEERLLLPALAQRLGGPVCFYPSLRADHAGLVALCVPVPEREWLEGLSEQLSHHLSFDAVPGGLLDTCDAALRDDAELVRALERFTLGELPRLARGASVRAAMQAALAAVGLGPCRPQS